MSPVAALVLAAFLVLANGFFVGVEFALLAARSTLLEARRSTSRGSRAALHGIERLPLMIAACQFGITLCSLGLGAVGEPAVSHVLEPVFELVRLPEAAVHPVSFGLALLVISLLHMLLGEMVPKNIALAEPERTAVVLTPVLLLFFQLFRPVVVALTRLALAVLRLVGVSPVDESSRGHTTEEVAALVAEARREGLLGGSEHRLLTSALDLQGRTARDVMLPAASLVCVPSDVTPAQVEEVVARTGYSRFPVDSEPAGGQLTGYVHIADVLGVAPALRGKPIPPSVVRPLPTSRADSPLQDVLTALQRSAAHLSRVVDDAGNVVGILALEDVLEELVGEVRDLAHASGRPTKT